MAECFGAECPEFKSTITELKESSDRAGTELSQRFTSGESTVVDPDGDPEIAKEILEISQEHREGKITAEQAKSRTADINSRPESLSAISEALT